MICAQKLSSEGQEVKKKKSRANPLPSGKRKSRNFKFSTEELEALVRKAEVYFNGDISGWVRFASTMLIPDEEQISMIKKASEGSRLLK
jgi:hypothetical protein